jgi:hypothetical protein
MSSVTLPRVLGVLAFMVAAWYGPIMAHAATGSMPGEVILDETSLVSQADGRLQARRASPLKETAYLHVETDPVDADIRIDGSLEGRGRVFLRIRDSRWVRVTASLPGYPTVDGFAEMSEREVTKLRLALRTPTNGGNLTVISEPNGAEVRLDGTPVGQTPLTLHKVVPGSHVVSLSHGGWTWEDRVDVRLKETNLVLVPVGASAVSRQVAAPAPAPTPVATPAPAPRPAPAARTPAPAPAPAVVVQPAPAPAPATVAVAPAPAPAPSPEPEPEPAMTGKGAKKPNCKAICDQFVKAVDSDGARDPIRSLCMRRCDGGDMAFSVCAWKVRTMSDVLECGRLPE